MSVNGQSGAIEQPAVYQVDPVRGVTLTRTWFCTSLTSADTKVAEMVFQGASVTKTEGAKPVVVAVFGFDPDKAEQPQDEFTLDSNAVQKDFLDADHPLVNALNTNNRDELRKYIQDPSAYISEHGFSGEAATGVDGISFAAVTKLWALVQAGVRHFEVEQPVFRLTRFVSRLYNAPFSYANIGKLLSTAAMKTDSLAPSDFLVPIDDIVAQFFTPIRQDGLEVAYAWKKKSPRVSGSGWNKRRIDQEYTYGLWSTAMYGNPL